ncbi:MAG: hypothetical protein ACLQGJ_07650 [Candidatus Dormibacteria bacterium]
MTLPPLGFSAPDAEELLGEDWFGAGSVFETGEELANALMVLASGQMTWPVPVLTLPGLAQHPPPSPEHPGVRAVPPGPFGGPAPAAPPDEFQVAAMPSSREREPSGWAGRSTAPLERRRRPRGGPPLASSGWSIRQSVQILRVTEDILCRLREEAAQLTWHLAAAVHRETDLS